MSKPVLAGQGAQYVGMLQKQKDIAVLLRKAQETFGPPRTLTGSTAGPSSGEGHARKSEGGDIETQEVGQVSS